MAALKTLFNKYQIFTFKPPPFSIYIQQNEMSQYPTYYIKPIYKKEEQEKMFESGDAQKLAHVPTRAALNDQTCSPTQDDLLNLLINYVMDDGKKILAREQVGKTIEKIKRIQLEKYHKASTEEEKQKIELNPKIIIHKAIDNGKPLLRLTPIKRGGVTYQVPVPISAKTSQFISMKWFIEAGQEKEKTVRFYDKLAYEFIDAFNNTGRVVKKKQDLHKQCETNRAYAHYRWS